MNRVKDTDNVSVFNRRRFLEGLIGGTGLAVISPGGLEAKSLGSSHAEVPSVLVDITRCIGCRSCMRACKIANDLPNNTELSEGFPNTWTKEELRYD